MMYQIFPVKRFQLPGEQWAHAIKVVSLSLRQLVALARTRVNSLVTKTILRNKSNMFLCGILEKNGLFNCFVATYHFFSSFFIYIIF